MMLSNYENTGNRYKEVTSPMSEYRGQLKAAKFIKKMQYWFILEMQPQQFAGVCISCLKNDLLRHWLDL